MEMIDGLMSPTVVSSLDGTIISANDAACKMFGHTRAALVGKNVRMLMSDTYAAQHSYFMNRYESTGEASLMGKPRKVYGRRESGALFPVEISLGKFDANGVRCYAATFREIQSSGSGSGSRSGSGSGGGASIVDRMMNCIVVCNPDMYIVQFNGAAEKMFGYAKEEVIGKKVQILMPDVYAREHDGYIANYRETGERKLLGVPRELLGRTKGGVDFPIEISLSECKMEEENETLYLAVFRKLSEADVSRNSGAFVARYEHDFREVVRLGRGGYGAVYLVQHVIAGVNIGKYAVKKVPVGTSSEWIYGMLREVKALESVRHRNVVSYKHSWIERHRVSGYGPALPCLFILMEYANGGNLANYLYLYTEFRRKNNVVTIDANPQKRYLSEATIWRLFCDACLGLQYLHRIGVIHRDIKPENMLLHTALNHATGREETRLLYTDFGTSVFKNNPANERTGFTGTVGFTAPELLVKDAQGRFRHAHTTKSDVWGLGIVLYCLCFSRVPFSPIKTEEEIEQDILQTVRVALPSSPNRSPLLHALLNSLLDVNPDNRPTIDELLGTPVMAHLVASLNSADDAAAGTSGRGGFGNSAAHYQNDGPHGGVGAGSGRAPTGGHSRPGTSGRKAIDMLSSMESVASLNSDGSASGGGSWNMIEMSSPVETVHEHSGGGGGGAVHSSGSNAAGVAGAASTLDDWAPIARRTRSAANKARPANDIVNGASALSRRSGRNSSSAAKAPNVQSVGGGGRGSGASSDAGPTIASVPTQRSGGGGGGLRSRRNGQAASPFTVPSGGGSGRGQVASGVRSLRSRGGPAGGGGGGGGGVGGLGGVTMPFMSESRQILYEQTSRMMMPSVADLIEAVVPQPQFEPPRENVVQRLTRRIVRTAQQFTPARWQTYALLCVLSFVWQTLLVEECCNDVRLASPNYAYVLALALTIALWISINNDLDTFAWNSGPRARGVGVVDEVRVQLFFAFVFCYCWTLLCMYVFGDVCGDGSDGEVAGASKSMLISSTLLLVAQTAVLLVFKTKWWWPWSWKQQLAEEEEFVARVTRRQGGGPTNVRR